MPNISGIKAALISIVLNTILAAVKIITGILGNAYALIANGIESLLDIFSSTIVLSGVAIGSLPPDKDHPFGHGKAESLAAMTVSLVLIGVAIGIAIQSVKEILHPQHTPASYTLIVLIVVVIIKETLFRFLSRISHQENSLSLKADAWHNRSDALTSLAAFIGILIAIVGGEGFEAADDWAAIAASAVILFNGFAILKTAVSEIMDSAADPAIEETIRAKAREVKGVEAIEKCRVRKSGTGYFVELHVEVDGSISVKDGHDIAHDVKDYLLKSNLKLLDCVIHIEPKL